MRLYIIVFFAATILFTLWALPSFGLSSEVSEILHNFCLLPFRATSRLSCSQETSFHYVRRARKPFFQASLPAGGDG